MLRNLPSETLLVKESINSRPITIFIDSGIAHIFIQDCLVKFLGLQTSSSSHFQVLVGNGDCLECNYM